MIYLNNRQGYAVRYGLDQSWWQLPVSFSSNPKKSNRLSLMQVLIIIGSVLLCAILFGKTPALHGSMIANIAWILGYVGLFYLLAMPTKTYNYGVKMIKPMINYYGDRHRLITTRPTANAAVVGEFYGYGNATIKRNGERQKVGITRDGYILRNDGTLMAIVEVEGNLSSYLQNYVIDQIIDSATTFYRSIPKTTEVHFITKQTTQRVVTQILHEHERINNLKQIQASMADPKDLQPLVEIENKKLSALQDYVGTEFKTLRQFAVIQAESKEDVETTIDIMYGCMNVNGGGAFRSLRVLTDPDEVRVWLHNQNCSLSQIEDYDTKARKVINQM